MLNRRSLLIAGAALGAGAAFLRPSDKGGNYNSYFAKMNQTLRENNISTPSLVIDLDRLDRNIDRVVQSVSVAPQKTFRVVTKSIPSVDLVDYVANRAATNSLMVFHLPFLQAMTKRRPEDDILLGKPMPAAAASTFYAEHKGSFNPERQLQWLIDTGERLQQYLQVAKTAGTRMRINLELDVGLHRGGFEAGETLGQALAVIEDNPQHLKLSGFMGYDAHIMGIPQMLAKAEIPRVKERYNACIEQLRTDFPSLAKADLCFNGAGSPTFRLYEGDTTLNDLSMGSCLMKPGDFDLSPLDEFEASAFIASPVLKRLQGGRLPALGWAGSMIRGWDQNQRQTYFCYGGKWMAEPESPPGLSKHFAYGSSNQQGYTASESVGLEVDDFIFLRPTQSEAVLLQFGDLVLVRGDEIVDRWPVLTAEV